MVTLASLCEIISLCAHILDKSCRDFDTSNDQKMGKNQDVCVVIKKQDMGHQMCQNWFSVRLLCVRLLPKLLSSWLIAVKKYVAHGLF